MRRAARTDASQQMIVEALKKIGANPVFIGKPLDLLVGYRGRNILLEVKNAREGHKQGELTQAQEEFMASWPGEAHIVNSIEEAISKVVGELYVR